MSYLGPQDQIKDPEVFREFQEVSRAMAELPQMRILYNEPQRPRKGIFCICDGMSWDPLGDGLERPVYFDGTSWKAFG